MVDEIKAKSTATLAGSAASSEAKKKSDQLGQTEFLQLLVTQLKNQDPMDPMKSDEFAVNLSQFAQLERLVSIDDKLGKSEPNASDSGTLTGYLGRRVSFESDKLEVLGGKADEVLVDLPDHAQLVDLEILGPGGSSIGRVTQANLDKGRNPISLSELNLPDGHYGVRVTATGSNGEVMATSTLISGIVNGVQPGDDPLLLVGTREVRPADVKEVRVA